MFTFNSWCSRGVCMYVNYRVEADWLFLDYFLLQCPLSLAGECLEGGGYCKRKMVYAICLGTLTVICLASHHCFHASLQSTFIILCIQFTLSMP
jgi:hypothetical protein